ncbi:response regulator transcription factor [Streptomyces barringtoniae]|uniref:response regulator transcription factor n=1 Tax=Streptomyces barringtoniae TaxID=2892029 RepID=UPI003557C8DC|nr:helix-turn-helix transcriptional regulator [Streptomyces barringtoniae]
MSRSRTCDVCGAALIVRPHGGRPARYCSSACRQRARRRRAAEGATPAVPTAGGSVLPPALDSFVGRRHELSGLRTLLRSSRLLTLTGSGGVGKTRLTPEFARVLTARESTVAELVAEELTDRQIADRLGLSVHTVATHLDKIRKKQGLSSRTQIAPWAPHGPRVGAQPGGEHLAGRTWISTSRRSAGRGSPPARAATVGRQPPVVSRAACSPASRRCTSPSRW